MSTCVNRFHQGIRIGLVGLMGTLMGGGITQASENESHIAFEPFQAEAYAGLWKRSPFTLASAESSGPGELERRYALASVTMIGDRPFVRLVDLSDGRSNVDPAAVGIEVVGVELSEQYMQTRVTLRKGNQVARVGFNQELVRERRIAGGAASPAGPAPSSSRVSSRVKPSEGHPPPPARSPRVIRRRVPVPEGKP